MIATGEHFQLSQVRPAAQAGRFYPADAAELNAALDEMLRPADAELRAMLPEAGTPAQGQAPLALLTPHAGYVYSGAVAGAAFAAVPPGTFDHVLLLAPSHYGDFSGAALPDAGAFATPLGIVALDVAAMWVLLNEQVALIDNEAHAPEHAIEVELPFLQRVMAPDFQLLPLLLARVAPGQLRGLADALERLLQARRAAGERWLVVASSDTYHGYDADDCERNDQALLELLCQATPENFVAATRRREVMACGWAPLAVALDLARRGGALGATPLARGDSRRGRPFERGGYVVGYVGAAFYNAQASA